jgi:predicted GIY-YIG superfamily endonuclease
LNLLIHKQNRKANALDNNFKHTKTKKGLATEAKVKQEQKEKKRKLVESSTTEGHGEGSVKKMKGKHYAL